MSTDGISAKDSYTIPLPEVMVIYNSSFSSHIGNLGTLSPSGSLESTHPSAGSSALRDLSPSPRC